jgi:hypothetical protein
MSAVFDALPGIEVDVGSIAKGLADLWRDLDAGSANAAIEDAKATQVNFVLHLGLNTTPDDAVEQFQVVSRFSQRYPSRIVVLCPVTAAHDALAAMRAKLYGECYFGKSKADKRCVEFVMLSYPTAARQFLENQVSICLSTDLPVYYWAHRFTATVKLADYRYLLNRAKRVLIDSALAPAGVMTHPWPQPEKLRDLAFARLLPIRQTIGQLLAGYTPAVLVDGIQTVAVTHTPELAAEATVLREWLRGRLAACGAAASVGFVANAYPNLQRRLAVGFTYANSSRMFRWSGDLATGHALFEADFGAGATKLPAAASLLAPENALSEAMFF